ncbi:MAG: bifunctional glutamate N-acetyltransferase/amino-acid acetyltransferase ArgJ [Deltaproteobacteria bacterium]|nr:bifunctional glutamate N-acetyltransferase/amino-acid acetyltransferase ArgJ [Deltaproteobacteria bacterium]
MTQNAETYAVPGFLANGIHAGIKQDSMKDLALIFSTVPAKVSALFTKNRIKAAPVLLDMERVKTGLAQAIVANSGNANAATGPAGYGDAVEMSKIASQRLHINDELVLVASTGVIGHRLPLDNIRVGMNELVEGLHQEGVRLAAEAIMTTDKYSKISCRKGFIGSKEITVCGIAKGAGMIEPHMATMLAFVITDADIDSRVLKTVFRGAADRSFNAITVDGCMSTNDTAIILANGVARNTRLTSSSVNTSLFKEMLCHVMSDLSLDMIRDGEGATKVIEIFVDEAKSVAEAKRVAYAIANSNLVKTAFYGCDPNWGRIMAAAGSTGVQFPLEGITLYIENIPVFARGCRAEGHEKELTEIMTRKEIKVHLMLGMGDKAYRVYASDLSMEYIRINAHYHT